MKEVDERVAGWKKNRAIYQETRKRRLREQRRAQYAAMVMAGFAANPDIKPEVHDRELAESAVSFADALLEELDKR